MPDRRYMWASVQTVRGCPKHCSFCSAWRTDGQEPRQRAIDRVVREVVELRRLGFRFIALADDNFYPVSFDDLAQARRRSDPERLRELEALRGERFALMSRLAALPVPITQHWLIPEERRPKLFSAYPIMSLEQIRDGTQHAWDRFYSWRSIWDRSRVVESARARIAFVLISKLYRQMYANTGIARACADRSGGRGWIGRPCRGFFVGEPMPELEIAGQ